MSRILEIRQGVLDYNDRLAADLRNRFQVANVYVTNWLSSPGAGKTALLEVTMRRMTEQGYSVAALVGDLATENDANRLARSGAPVRQIVTAGCCHLEAHMVNAHLEGWDLTAFDFLFIENVGNLVCPSGYDLGEDCRIVLMSTTEGEDKPLKYPNIFHSADLAVITKIDIAEVVEFDRELAYSNIHAIRSSIPILETAAKTGQGIDEWIELLIMKKETAARESVATS